MSDNHDNTKSERREYRGVVDHDPDDGWYLTPTEPVQGQGQRSLYDMHLLGDFKGKEVLLTIEPLADRNEPSLEEQLIARLREWFKRSAPLTQTNWKEPSITFCLRHPQADNNDEKTLYLEAVVEEKTLDDLEGRVPGVKFR